MKSLSRAILRTLVYADIFDYPLTSNEIYWFLITEKKQDARRKTQKEVKKELDKNTYLLSRISYHDRYYFLKGRGKIVAWRKKRERWSRKKLQIARRVARWLRLIPWIKMVAVTGALAMENASQEDDIDLLIVTAENRLWLTRLLAVSLVELTARRRRPGDKDIKDKICLNMFLDEARLNIPKKEQDLFTAHEVCQLKPLWERGGVYRRFLKANRWAREHLVNATKWKIESEKWRKKKIISCQLTRYAEFLRNAIISFAEHLARQTQLWYMRSRRTTEIVESGRVRFHPEDCRGWIMLKYSRKLKTLGLR